MLDQQLLTSWLVIYFSKSLYIFFSHQVGLFSIIIFQSCFLNCFYQALFLSNASIKLSHHACRLVESSSLSSSSSSSSSSSAAAPSSSSSSSSSTTDVRKQLFHLTVTYSIHFSQVGMPSGPCNGDSVKSVTKRTIQGSWRIGEVPQLAMQAPKRRGKFIMNLCGMDFGRASTARIRF